MMTDDRDPILQGLFVEAQQDLDGDGFIAQVLARTNRMRYQILTGLVCLGLMLAAGSWFFAIPLEAAQLIAQLLTIALIDLGDGWLAWLFSPVNNVASLLVLSVKGMRMLRKKLTRASYVG